MGGGRYGGSGIGTGLPGAGPGVGRGGPGGLGGKGDMLPAPPLFSAAAMRANKFAID